MERRAKIVATLGPASTGKEVLARLLDAGVDAVRLNLSHGTHDEHRRALRRVRAAAEARDRFVPVIVDLMGPRYRLGDLPEPRLLERGERVTLGREGADLPVGDPGILRHLKRGDRVLVDHGLVALEVVEKRGRKVAARVTAGGTVSTRKGINLPDTDLPFTVSEKDRADLAFAAEEGADYAAASYVGRREDLEDLRSAMPAAGELPLIAKLERGRAVENLEPLIADAEGVMVARGDLGVELPLHEVPALQKRIVAAGRRAGKPVIVATQMLESMTEHPRPTRAEASDVANAVFDGADALMLSGETAAGRYPVEAVETMVRIILASEEYLAREGQSGRAGAELLLPRAAGEDILAPPTDVPDVVCAAGVFAARRLGVRSIVAFSQGGFTARAIARHRPETPILVFTTDRSVARQMHLIWGVRPFVMDVEVEHHDEVVALVERLLLAADLAEPGDAVVILMGDPIRERPLTNLLRVHRVREPRRRRRGAPARRRRVPL